MKPRTILALPSMESNKVRKPKKQKRGKKNYTKKAMDYCLYTTTKIRKDDRDYTTVLQKPSSKMGQKHETEQVIRKLS